MLESYLGLIRKEPRPLFYSAVHTFFSGFGQTFFIALFLPQLQSIHRMSHMALGSLYSAATICSACLIPFLGACIDRTHLRRYSLLVNSGLIIGYLLLIKARSPLVLFLALFFIRLCGQALLPHISATASSRYFQKFRGRALAISGLGHPIGEAILPLLLAFLLKHLGWEDSLSFLIFINAVLFIPTVIYLLPKNDLFLQPTFTSIAKENDQKTSTWKLIKSPFFLSILPSLMAYPFIGTGLFFHQAAIAAQKGWELQWMIACFPIYAICRVIGTFSGGFFVDKWAACSLSATPLIPLFLSLLVISTQNSPWAIPLYMGGFGTTIGLASCIYTALWAECYGTEELGRIKSAMKPFIIASTAVSPVAFGWCLDEKTDLKGLFFMCFSFLFTAAILLKSPWVRSRFQSALQRRL
ncbi:MAG: MFS transporter [Oligoflexales bacterium]